MVSVHTMRCETGVIYLSQSMAKRYIFDISCVDRAPEWCGLTAEPWCVMNPASVQVSWVQYGVLVICVAALSLCGEGGSTHVACVSCFVSYEFVTLFLAGRSRKRQVL